jgi:hypothetical protein
MSLVEDLGARVHGAAEDLPIGSVTVAVQRLRVGLELLQWVRQESAHDVGVVHLANATEQLEQAMLALRGAQDSVAEYLTAIGLAYDAAPTADTSWRSGLAPPVAPPSTSDTPVDTSPLSRWWTERVDEVAGQRDPPDSADAGESASDAQEAASDSTELLRRVAEPVRAGDRERLRRELRRVQPPVGLGLAAISPPVARHLATDLLGHEPTAADLPRLTRDLERPVRELLPGLPEHVMPTLLARVCRVPPPPPSAKNEDRDEQPEAPPPTHPTDPAVAQAVLVGVLLHRLHRDPDTLRAEQRDA